MKPTASREGGRGRVLVVDDDLGARLTTEALLSDEFDVILACQADQALDYLSRENVSVVVTDFVMPGMNGIDLLTLIKQRVEFVHGVLVTGYRDNYFRWRAKQNDITFDVLIKPYNPTELISIVRRAVDVDRLRRTLSAFSDKTPPKSRRIGRP